MKCPIEGCNEKAMRKAIPQHVENNSFVYIQLMMRSIEQTQKVARSLSRLTRKLATQVKELKNEKISLKNQVKKMKEQLTETDNAFFKCNVDFTKNKQVITHKCICIKHPTRHSFL